MGVTGGGEEQFDLGKVLQESWDLERTPDDEFLLKHIAFPTPRRQLEQLEYLYHFFIFEKRKYNIFFSATKRTLSLLSLFFLF